MCYDLHDVFVFATISEDVVVDRKFSSSQFSTTPPI